MSSQEAAGSTHHAGLCLMHLHLLLAARSWLLSRGSLWQPVAAVGFLFSSPGTSHQENLSRKLSMEETTRVRETPKPQI